MGAQALFTARRSPVYARRVSAAPSMGGSPFLGSRSLVHTSCVSNTPFLGWGFRRLRAAGTGRTRGGRKKERTPTVSFPL